MVKKEDITKLILYLCTRCSIYDRKENEKSLDSHAVFFSVVGLNG